MGMDFLELKAKINVFKSTAKQTLVNDAEKFFKDNIRLGGNQMPNGYIKPFAPRTHNYSHPMLIETGQMLNNIKASYHKGHVKVSVRVNNYRGKRDYSEIHNKYGTPTKGGNVVRPFLSQPQALIKREQQKFVGMLKKIFI